jgi:hypothetical protein
MTLLSMTDAEAETVLWCLSQAKEIADEQFPRSCKVAQIESVSKKLMHEMSGREHRRREEFLRYGIDGPFGPK